MQTDLNTIVCDNTQQEHTARELESEILTDEQTPHKCALKNCRSL